MLFDQIEPLDLDEAFRRRQPAVAIDGADQRLAGIGQDGVLIAPAGLGLARRHQQKAAQLDPLRDPGERFPTHHGDETLGDLTFMFGLVAIQQPLGDDQAQYPIAEKFKPFVAKARLAAVGQLDARVGQGLAQQGAVMKPMTDPVDQRIGVEIRTPGPAQPS